MTSEGYHEPLDSLTERTRDHHRAMGYVRESRERNPGPC